MSANPSPICNEETNPAVEVPSWVFYDSVVLTHFIYYSSYVTSEL